jgi:hypothetical protein
MTEQGKTRLATSPAPRCLLHWGWHTSHTAHPCRQQSKRKLVLLDRVRTKCKTIPNNCVRDLHERGGACTRGGGSECGVVGHVRKDGRLPHSASTRTTHPSLLAEDGATGFLLLARGSRLCCLLIVRRVKVLLKRRSRRQLEHAQRTQEPGVHGGEVDDDAVRFGLVVVEGSLAVARLQACARFRVLLKNVDVNIPAHNSQHTCSQSLGLISPWTLAADEPLNVGGSRTCCVRSHTPPARACRGQAPSPGRPCRVYPFLLHGCEVAKRGLTLEHPSACRGIFPFCLYCLAPHTRTTGCAQVQLATMDPVEVPPKYDEDGE